MKIGTLLTEIHRNENALRHELLELAERHRAAHEIHHVARDLARWSGDHLGELAAVGSDHGRDLPVPPAVELTPAEADSSGMDLLCDLRSVYMNAAGLSVQWVMLGQAAQALHLGDLLTVIRRCHPGTLRQMRWAATSLKQQSTQILVS